jgi:DNA-binding NarL/FixJ family response regulator
VKLTPRQRDVVVLLDAGLSCPEIGQRLGIAEKTVRRNVEDIYELLRAEGLPGDRLKPIRRIVLNARTMLDGA